MSPEPAIADSSSSAAGTTRRVAMFVRRAAVQILMFVAILILLGLLSEPTLVDFVLMTPLVVLLHPVWVLGPLQNAKRAAGRSVQQYCQRVFS